MIVAFMGAYGFTFAVISPVLAPLAKAFGISIPTAAYISTFMFVGAAIMSIPAGLIVDRWGIKKAGILAQVLLVLGWLATYVAPSFDVQCVEGGVDSKTSNGRLMALASTEPHAVWLKLMISHLG